MFQSKSHTPLTLFLVDTVRCPSVEKYLVYSRARSVRHIAECRRRCQEWKTWAVPGPSERKQSTCLKGEDQVKHSK